MQMFNINDIQPFLGDDRSIIRELASPRNSSLTRHSLAEIRHPPGTASQEHYHTEAEVPNSALGTELPCPHCGATLRLNPFVIEADWQPVAAAWRGKSGTSG